MRTKSNKNHKCCLLLIKYIPIITLLLQLIYLYLYLFGYNIEMLINISGISVLQFMIIYNLLNVFKYCIIQKLIVNYITIVDIVLKLNINAHLILVIIGTLILIITIYYKLFKLKTYDNR